MLVVLLTLVHYCHVHWDSEELCAALSSLMPYTSTIKPSTFSHIYILLIISIRKLHLPTQTPAFQLNQLAQIPEKHIRKVKNWKGLAQHDSLMEIISSFSNAGEG